MDIKDLLLKCIDGGIKLVERHGELRVHYSGPVPNAALMMLLKQHKEELVRHLRERSRERSGGASIPVLSLASREQVPVSPAQRRMWLMHRLEESSAQYNMVGAYKLQGPLDSCALKKSLDEVVARHEALRSSYVERDGDIVQLVREPFGVLWDRVDVSAQTPVERELALQGLLQRENTWRFNLEAGPLIRATSVRYSDDLLVLIINVHHIACDGWSIEILKREIGACYAAFAYGRSLELAPVGVQYADYAEWQRNNSSRAEFRRQVDYWKCKLDGVPQLHNLALDKPRPALQTYSGRRLRRDVSGERLRDIKVRCEGSGVTLFMYLHTVLTAVLAVYSNERDVVIGFPVAGRRHRDIEATVGVFVNTVVLRCRVEGNPTFEELLTANKVTILEALENQDVPYEQLVEELRPGRSRAHSPLVQTLFTLQNQIEGNFALPGVVVEQLDNEGEPVKFDLQVVAEELDDCLQIDWHFNADLFADESVARMAESYSLMIDAAVRRPDMALYSLPIAHGREEGSASEPTQDMTRRSSLRLDELFEANAQANPGNLAVSYEDESLTYAELNERADRLAACLRMLGVSRASPVGLCVHRSIETIVGILGILKAGGAYVPLDPTHPMSRIGAILSDCGAEVLLTQQRLLGETKNLAKKVVALDDEAAYATLSTRSSEGRDDSRAATDPAYVIYTSGTTGTPKGVVVPHFGVGNLIEHFEALAPLTAPWNGALWCSISFDVSVYEIFSPLCRGGTVHIVPDRLRLEPELLFGWMNDRELNSVFMHAGYLEPFGEYLKAGQGCRSLKRILVGVEPIASSQLHAIVQQLPDVEILNGYGPTETSICCTIFRFPKTGSRAANARVPIGQAVQGMTLHVMNVGGEPAPRGAVGELYVGGIGLALGYLNKPELTDARFVTKTIGTTTRRLYRTGDLVRCLPSGDLEFIGRVDDQIKIRGFRIEPAEIEVRLCGQPEISDAFVTALGEGAEKALVAYLVLKQGHALDQDGQASFVARTRRDLKQFLPDYMVPNHIVVLERIPMTVNGKVDRAALPSPCSGNPRTAIVAPRNDIERQLVDLWKEVLAIDEVGVTDDFFALGGHSLLATRLMSRTRRQFQIHEVDLSIRDVFDHPTIETMAEAVAAAVLCEQARKKETYLASLGQNVEEGVF